MISLLSGIGDKMDSAHSKWVEDYTHSKYRTITVQCFTLHSLLLAIGQTEVDYFSLDVEGPELEILQTIPFDKIRIKVITIEYRVYGNTTTENIRMSLEKLDKIRSFFRSLGNYKEAGILPRNRDKKEEDERWTWCHFCTNLILVRNCCRHSIKVHSHWTSVLTFASNFNVVSMVMLTIDAENGYRTHSLHLHLVTITSIIFKNANSDIHAKCEWAYKIDCLINFLKTILGSYFWFWVQL